MHDLLPGRLPIRQKEIDAFAVGEHHPKRRCNFLSNLEHFGTVGRRQFTQTHGTFLRKDETMPGIHWRNVHDSMIAITRGSSSTISAGSSPRAIRSKIESATIPPAIENGINEWRTICPQLPKRIWRIDRYEIYSACRCIAQFLRHLMLPKMRLGFYTRS